MPVPARVVGALLVAAASGSAALVAVAGAGLPEWVFGTALLLVAALVVERSAAGWLRARSEGARAARLTGLDPADASREAVRRERERLSGDISVRLRALVAAVGADVDAARAAADPTAALTRIHRTAQEAAAELRRQLGLLRPDTAADDGADAPRVAPGPARAGRPDVLVALGTAALAGVEAVAHPRSDGIAVAPASVVLTVVAAATVVGVRAAPAAAATFAGTVFGLAALLDAAAVGGLWCLVTVGGLLWSLTTAARPGASEALGGGLLVVGAVGATAWRDPQNAGVLAVVALVAVVAGLLTGAARRRADAARRAADDAAGSLTLATTAAVEAERAAFAREVHDVVSHAVGLVAVQSAAAQVSWPDRPLVVRQALDVIGETAAAAVAEFDRLELDGGRPRTADDVSALVRRIRAGGTPVRVVRRGDVPPDRLDVVYRVVQETLTNVVRHAPGATATVEIDVSGDAVRVVVADDGPGSAAPGRGYGLTGLEERVAFAGGTLVCGGGGGGFRVAVVLPRTAEPVP